MRIRTMMTAFTQHSIASGTQKHRQRCRHTHRQTSKQTMTRTTESNEKSVNQWLDEYTKLCV